MMWTAYGQTERTKKKLICFWGVWIRGQRYLEKRLLLSEQTFFSNLGSGWKKDKFYHKKHLFHWNYKNHLLQYWNYKTYLLY